MNFQDDNSGLLQSSCEKILLRGAIDSMEELRKRAELKRQHRIANRTYIEPVLKDIKIYKSRDTWISADEWIKTMPEERQNIISATLKCSRMQLPLCAPRILSMVRENKMKKP